MQEQGTARDVALPYCLRDAMQLITRLGRRLHYLCGQRNRFRVPNPVGGSEDNVRPDVTSLRLCLASRHTHMPVSEWMATASWQAKPCARALVVSARVVGATTELGWV